MIIPNCSYIEYNRKFELFIDGTAMTRYSICQIIQDWSLSPDARAHLSVIVFPSYPPLQRSARSPWLRAAAPRTPADGSIPCSPSGILHLRRTAPPLLSHQHRAGRRLLRRQARFNGSIRAPPVPTCSQHLNT